MVRVFANGTGELGSNQIESYQRLKKWYLILSCLTHRIIRYGSRVKWSNPGKGVGPSPTAIEKGDFGSPSTTLLTLCIVI